MLAITDPGRFDLELSSTTLHDMPDLEVALHHLRGLVASGGTAILADNVAARPTPPGLVYWFGAVREFPPTYAATAGSRRGWLLKFRISTAWLDHLASDRYLSRQVFQQRYGAVFPGAQFYRLGYAHAAVWHNPHNHQAVLQHGPRRRVAPCDRLEPLKQTSCAAGRAQGASPRGGRDDNEEPGDERGWLRLAPATASTAPPALRYLPFYL